MDPKLKAITDGMASTYSHIGWMLAGWLVALAVVAYAIAAVKKKQQSA